MSAIAIPTLSHTEATSLTEDIRNHATAVWSLLIRAHQGKAWAVLGYETWAEYVSAEFNMSRGRSYQILDQARVIQAIESAVSTKVDIPEREARDLKRDLPAIVAAAKSAIDDLGAEATDDEKGEAVKAVIAASRPAVSIKHKTTDETTETYDAQTGEVLDAEALLSAAENSQALQDSRYVTAFIKALGAVDSLWLYDAERVGSNADQDVLATLRSYANLLEKFTQKVERSARGLRLIEGGKA